jgi:predicted cobalt transporter CbtA
MERKLIEGGVVAGALAGLLSFIFARIFAEPLIQQAIDYESARDHAQELIDKAAGVAVPAMGPDIFSRTIQADVGIGVAIIAFGAAMGALFAVAYAICLGRVGNLRPRSLSLLVAAGGFLGFYLVPFLKYPANPPAIGHPETIRDRSGLYLLMVVCSLLFLIIAVVAGRKLQPRFGNWNASILAGLGFVVAIGIVMAILPSFGELAANSAAYGRHATETPLPLRGPGGAIVFPGFSADLLFSFRLYSVAAQVLLWTTIGLAFAPMAERVLAKPMAERAEAARAA